MGKKSMPVAVAALLLALLAGLVSVGAVPAGAVVARADGEMSEQRAGQYYLRVACAAGPPLERFSRVAFGGRDRISGQEVRRRLPELRRAAGVWAPSIYRYARGLLNPPKDWPLSVAGKVDVGAANLLKMHGAIQDMSGASSAIGFIDHYKRAVKFARKVPGVAIRARLDLPPPGRGC